MNYIGRFELGAGQWVNTSAWALDGKEHYRELPRYGNKHAVFEPGAPYGDVHYDQYNALGFPIDTVNHLAKWANERTGINEGAARLGIWALGLYALSRLAKQL